MKRFLLGLVLGLALGGAGAALAAAFTIAGKDGYLLGWEVRLGDQAICSDPYVRAAHRSIDCD